MNRFRESRESLGYAAEEVATHLSATVGEVLAIEAGAPVTSEALRTLCRLYLRPQGYLLAFAAGGERSRAA
jgi:transcriptional regulator with XRE-family HTH domain